jgi:hypothetical protein
MKRLVALLLGIAISDPATARDNPFDLVGVWSGQHAVLSVGRLDAGFELDCADGMFVAPYHVARNGAFKWYGTFTPGTGGPVRRGKRPRTVVATYTGIIKWPDEMRISVKLGNGRTLGPYTLRRGAEPQLTRCL